MKVLILYFCLGLLLLFGCQQKQQPEKNEPVKIIFDTDMGPDFDDVGAIAVLHSLAAMGECEIIACGSSDSNPYTAPAIDVFNSFFGKPEIPVGAAGHSAPGIQAANAWNDSLCARFSVLLKTGKKYPPAVDVYRKALSDQPDKSVTIVSVGFLTNLRDLLQSGPDGFSPLSGIELVRQKVIRWVAMAGCFPEGSEFNVNCDPESSRYVLQNWPTPVLFSGFRIGDLIYTGGRVAKEGSAGNPVAWAYRYNLLTFEKKPVENRNSWDLTAVLCAVRNPEDYFYMAGPGRLEVEKNGTDFWDPEADARQFFLVHKYPPRKIAFLLDSLMMYEPVNKP